MISAFGVDHGGTTPVSKAYSKIQPRLFRAFRYTHPSETMRQRVDTNYIQNRLGSGIEGRRLRAAIHKPENKPVLDNARLGRQQTKAWETAANNMNRRKRGTGIARMEAAANQRLAGIPANPGVQHPGKTQLRWPPWEKPLKKPAAPTPKKPADKAPAYAPAPPKKSRTKTKIGVGVAGGTAVAGGGYATSRRKK